jgi:hypothetical protein
MEGRGLAQRLFNRTRMLDLVEAALEATAGAGPEVGTGHRVK